MIHLAYSSFPLVFGLLLILKTHNVNKSMLNSMFLGFVLFSARTCIRALFAANLNITVSLIVQIVIRSGLVTVSECLQLIKGIIIDKAAIFVAVFVLFLMVKLICSSCTLEYINLMAERYVKSRWSLLALLFGLSFLFSIDDYLCCAGVSAVSAGITLKHGISKEKAAYMVCLLALSFCTVLPYSSWNPVICAAINHSVPSGNVLWMNLGAFFFLSITAAEVLASEAPEDSDQKKTWKLPDNAVKVFGVLIATAISAVTALIIVNHLTDGTWSVATAGTAGSLVLLVAGTKIGILGKKIVLSGLHEAAADTMSLFKMLFLVWMVKDISLEMLGLSSSLADAMKAASLPPCMVPGVVYLISAGFAFMTGTSFGAFSLFIPISAELVTDTGVKLQSLAAAAALAGSLQSVNRPGSDVIRLVSGVLCCDEKKLMGLQEHFAVLTNLILFASFILAGFCAQRGTLVMFTAGMAPLLVCSVTLYIARKGASGNGKMEFGVRAAMGIPYTRTFRTFRQRCEDLEILYAAFFLAIQQKARSLPPVTFI